jgi:hypothetical protein
LFSVVVFLSKETSKASKNAIIPLILLLSECMMSVSITFTIIGNKETRDLQI